MRHARRHQRQVVKLLIRPAPPTGPGPATASGQVASRHEASHNVGHTRDHHPQPTTIRLQARSSQSHLLVMVGIATEETAVSATEP